MHAFSILLTVLIAFFVVCWQPAAATAIPSDVKIEGRALFDDELREFMEFLRLQMKCGYPPAGIPPLAPYHAESKQYLYDSPPWKISTNFTDLSITGLDEFDVVALSWNNVFQRLSFDYNFERIELKSGYKLQGHRETSNSRINFHGDGQLNLQVENFRAFGSFRLRPLLSGGLQVYDFKVQLDMGAAKSQTTGIMNSTLYTKIFNDWVEEFLRLIFVESVEEVSAAMERMLVPPMNKLFKKVSMLELVALIMGLVRDVLPTEAIC